MNKKILLVLPMLFALTGCGLVKDIFSPSDRTSNNSSTTSADSDLSEENTSSLEESSEDISSEISSIDTSVEESSYQIESEWPEDITEAMVQHLGEVLPYVEMDETTLYYDFNDFGEPDGGMYCLSICDESTEHALDNYGTLLVEAGYSVDEYECYSKVSALGDDLIVVFSYIEADEDDNFESGNEIDVYIYEPTEDSSSSEDPSEEPSESMSQEPAELISVTYDFTNTSFLVGTNLDVGDNVNELVSYMNSYPDYVTGITQEKCAFQTLHNDPSLTVLTIGSGSSSGSITFNFSQQITSISFTLQGYHKWNDYNNIWSMDAESQVDVLGQHYDLSSEDTTQLPPEVEDTIYLDPLANQITFSNSDEKQRVFLLSLTVEFIIF